MVEKDNQVSNLNSTSSIRSWFVSSIETFFAGAELKRVGGFRGSDFEAAGIQGKKGSRIGLKI